MQFKDVALFYVMYEMHAFYSRQYIYTIYMANQTRRGEARRVRCGAHLATFVYMSRSLAECLICGLPHLASCLACEPSYE